MTINALHSSPYLFALPRLLLLVSLLGLCTTSLADRQVTTDDGREVLLNDDGRWQFLSNDVFATTKEGQRIRLKEDGSWSYAGNTPLESSQQVRTSALDFQLRKVVVETYKKKSQKNSKIKTQTVFHIKLHLSPQAKSDIFINTSDTSLIKIQDNDGTNYPVLSLESTHTQLQPDNETTLIVRAEKSPPVWGNVKSMKIIFDATLFGLKNKVSLTQKVTDFENRNVSGFN